MGEEQVRRLVVAAPIAAAEAKQAPRRSGRRRGGGDEGEDGPQRDRLVRLGLNGAEYWHDRSLDGWASIEIKGRWENWPVRGRYFRLWLAGRFFEQHGNAPGGQALQEALAGLEAHAIHNGPQHDTWLRIGEAAGRIYLDLADESWRAVEIDGAGWRVVDRAPIKFRRTPAMRPLPEPCAGHVDQLRPFLNLSGEGDFRLVVSWLVAALRPTGPYPVLVLKAEQGSGKSTAAALLRALVDPNAAPIRAAPMTERDLMVGLHNAWSLVLDNLSSVPDWLSDALCRVSTGGGWATRELHSDLVEVVFSGTRPILLNGIADLTGRADLGDRSIVATLPPIPEDRRLSEADFWSDFHDEQPAILGALLNGVSAALHDLPHTRLDRLPRLADFALWSVASEGGLGFPPGAFEAAFEQNRADALEIAIESDPVAQALQLLVKDGGWTGTSAELLGALEGLVPPAVALSRTWPRSANGFSVRLRRLAPVLRAAGIAIDMFRDSGRDRRRLISVGCARPAGDSGGEQLPEIY